MGESRDPKFLPSEFIAKWFDSQAHMADLPSEQEQFSVAVTSKKRVRVVYFIAALVPGGAEKQLLLLLENLDRGRYLPHVIAFASGPWAGRFESLGLPLQIILYEQPKCALIANCWRQLRKWKPAIVHTYGMSANLWGRAAAITARVPIIIASERTAPFIKSQLKLLIDHIMRPFTDSWITNSRHAAEFYLRCRIANESRVAIIHNGIDVSMIPIASRSNRNPEIGTIAALRSEKNFDDLFRAMAKVVSQYPNAKLHIAGDGIIRPELETQAANYGIRSNIIFHGWVTDIGCFLAKLDIYVHTALYEGLPNSLMEAMAAGLPCIAYQTTGCAELIRHQETGILVSVANWMAIAEAMVEMIERPEFAAALGNKAHIMIERNFSVCRMVENTTRVYEECVARMAVL